MPENKDLQELADRVKKHESWLALKAAYQKYEASSRLWDSTIAQQQSEDSVPASERVFEAHQRIFEQYIEARMDFLGCWIDQANKPSMNHNSTATMLGSPPHKIQSLGVGWAPLANHMLTRRILPLILLCATAISGILQQRRTHELQSALHDLQVRLDQTRKALPSGDQVTDAKRVLEASPTLESARAIAPAAATTQRRPAVANRIRQNRPARTARKKAVQVTGMQKAPAATHGEGFRTSTYYPFRLSPSRQSKRLGPIRVTVSAIDPKRKSVRLSIVSDFGRLDLLQLRPNQPVWIPLGNRQKPLEFVVDRIGGTSLEGHLG
jgi:hypothetical protein